MEESSMPEKKAGVASSRLVLPAVAISPRRFWFLSIGVCLGLFLSILDSSVVATSLYTIGKDLDAIASVNWVALAYTLGYLGCAVAFARASDVIGRRHTFVAAYVLFFTFSLACGFAQDINQLIAFRSLQGVGGSGLYSLSMIILTEACPKHHLQFIGSLVGMVIAVSGVLGPILGGLLTQFTTWRWIFWINGPIGIVSLGIFLISWPTRARSSLAARRSWETFDYFGTFLVLAAAILVVYAFQNAGESRTEVWEMAIFLAPLITGVVLWLVILAWGYYLDRRDLPHLIAPAFPVSLFRNRFYASGALSTLLIGFPYLLIVFSFPTRAQVVSGKSALVSGIMLLPMLGSSALGSALSGKLNSSKNYLFETLLIGVSMMAIGCGLLTTVIDSDDDSKSLGFLTFTGFGFGLSTAAATILVDVEVPLVNSAAGHGIVAQMRILGGSLGVATSTILLRKEMSKHISDAPPSGIPQHPGGPSGTISDNDSSLIRSAYSKAFRKGMIISVAISGAALLATLIGTRTKKKNIHEQRASLAREEARRQVAEDVALNAP